MNAVIQNQPAAGKVQRTVLLVDDDLLVLESLARGLNTAGHLAVTAASVEAAEKFLDEGLRPDIAIVDIVMPPRSGLELAPRLRNGAATPFVILSAHSDAATVAQATAAGALGYLVKPVNVEHLIPAIEAALACAAECEELRKVRKQLQDALDSDRDTSVAIGVTMARHVLGRADAFDLLRSEARNQRRKLTELAREVVALQEAQSVALQSAEEHAKPS